MSLESANGSNARNARLQNKNIDNENDDLHEDFGKKAKYKILN